MQKVICVQNRGEGLGPGGKRNDLFSIHQAHLGSRVGIGCELDQTHARAFPVSWNLASLPGNVGAGLGLKEKANGSSGKITGSGPVLSSHHLL